MGQFDNWKARCHYLGELLTPAKGKSNQQKYDEAMNALSVATEEYMAIDAAKRHLATNIKKVERMKKLQETIDKLKLVKHIPHFSETAQARLSKIYTEVTTGRTKDIKAKYLEKGLAVEEQGITMYTMFTGKMFRKNKIRKENEWIEGELDFEDEEYTYDNKSPWDIFSFDQVAYKKLNPTYLWQQKGYMWLFGKKKGKLIYTLINTPRPLIEKEKIQLKYDFIGDANDLEEAYAEIEKNHIYDDLPLKRKIRIFDIELEDGDTDRIKKCIEDCRWYLNNYDQGVEEENDELEEEA